MFFQIALIAVALALVCSGIFFVNRSIKDPSPSDGWFFAAMAFIALDLAVCFFILAFGDFVGQR